MYNNKQFSELYKYKQSLRYSYYTKKYNASKKYCFVQHLFSRLAPWLGLLINLTAYVRK